MTPDINSPNRPVTVTQVSPQRESAERAGRQSAFMVGIALYREDTGKAQLAPRTDGPVPGLYPV